MTLWIILAALTAAGVLGVVWPLARSAPPGAASGRDVDVYKDQLREIDAELERGQIGAREAEASRIEISRRLLAVSKGDNAGAAEADSVAAPGALRKSAAAAALVLVPVLALGLYAVRGSPELPGLPHKERVKAEGTSKSVGELIARIEAHLRDNRDDARGWSVVAPVYMRTRRYDDAAAAYLRILEIRGRDPATLVAYGEALVMVEGGMVSAKAHKVLVEAEKRDRSIPKVQFYLGLADLQDGKPKAAMVRWQALLDKLPADAPGRKVVRQQLDIARARIGMPPSEVAKMPALSKQQAAAGKSMSRDQSNAMIEGMVARLAERLETVGGPVGDWLKLARSHKVLGRDIKAREALERAEKKFADDAAALTKIRDMRKSLGLDAGKATSGS